MFAIRSALHASVILLCAFTGIFVLSARSETPQQRRDRLVRAHKDGNYKVAYEGLRKLALDSKDDPKKVGFDLELAIHCLEKLGRSDEIDDFREAVIAVHAKNWRLLHRAALSLGRNKRDGQIVAGKFSRGNERDNGQYVSSFHRDRVRALQLYEKALALAEKDADKTAVAHLCIDFATMVLIGRVPRRDWMLRDEPPPTEEREVSVFLPPQESWRLGDLTDTSTLPGYEERDVDFDPPQQDAPVDEAGNPTFYRVPRTFTAAANDGERWRWLLARAAELDASLACEADWHLARFFRSQFGVRTMDSGWLDDAQSTADGKTCTFALHTLKDTETIAKLATGLKRFDVPDEFNWIKIYQRITARGKSRFGEMARDALAYEYEDRRQFVKAAAAWRKAIAEYGAGFNKKRQRWLDQIAGNWGRFEDGAVQPAGKKAVVHFHFRNGKKVHFEAHAVKVETLLADAKAFLKDDPLIAGWHKANIDDIGSRLVEHNETKYIGARVASWTEDLQPRPAHFDRRITVSTPLTQPGAYLLTAKMENGNTSRVIVWLADTALVKKQLEKKILYFIADAVTGQPVAGANVEFFGYKFVSYPPPRYRVETTSFARWSDADGQVILTSKDMPGEYRWIVVARKEKDGRGGADRLAYLRFNSRWHIHAQDERPGEVKTLTITDRPVYRPEDAVRFKAWVRHARHDEGDTSELAKKEFRVTIFNPHYKEVYEKTLTTDEFAGLTDTWKLPKDAMLGEYRFQVAGKDAGRFRVEEYKKPEFEVKVEAPREPVCLGEKIEATIQARYYFGAPVSRGRVKYKVMRSTEVSTWYPRGEWDWLFGMGYWWFASDYLWYPGWHNWGCARPHFSWWGAGLQRLPELVLENEVKIGADGAVKVTIETAAAKALCPNEDHRYTITAEVVDESRRTIVGKGDVLVTRKPFQVFAWVDRGHYRVGDTVKAGFAARSLDRKPVTGTGELTLYQIRYDKDKKPVENAVQCWKLDTDAEDNLRHQLKAAQAGQYRLSYKLTDVQKHTIEGGYIFVVHGVGFKGGKDFHFNDLELITDKREYRPGETVKLLINTNHTGSTVLLFVRPSNGVYLPPRVLRIKEKSTVEEIAVVQKDMPNFFVEALTVHDGRLHTEVREVIVPPEKRVLNVEVMPSLPEYKPGQKATVKVRLTDFFGKPFVGSAVMTVYDRSVEYISDGGNVPEIKEFFWKWRRHHEVSTESSLDRSFSNVVRRREIEMWELGIFAVRMHDEVFDRGIAGQGGLGGLGAFGGALGALGALGGGAPGALGGGALGGDQLGGKGGAAGLQLGGFRAFGGAPDGQGVPARLPRTVPAASPPLEPTVRTNFRDTAFWKPNLTTDKEGIAEVSFPMPEQLTGWKIKVWALGHGTRVGEGEIEVTTKKDLLLRMQAPRFFMQKDEVVLSANVHNYLKKDKEVAVSLEVAGGPLELTGSAVQNVKVAAGGEKRVDWRVKVEKDGPTIVRMKAVTDEESDAMQMSFPSHVHGMLKMEFFSGVIPADKNSGKIILTVPVERRIEQTRLEVRFTPTLAGTMVEALPYLVEYPYGCTEQTLNRFLPTVITQRMLQRMKLDLKAIQHKRGKLNAGKIGDEERGDGWKVFARNPVFDNNAVRAMVQVGVKRLSSMQCRDGGWGWFSGSGEQSWPHTTAVVLHGLQIAQAGGVDVKPNVLQRGVDWLTSYQAEEVRLLQNAAKKTTPSKEHADNLDALVHMVLADAGVHSNEMRDYLFRDRTHLAVYAKALFGLALHKQKEAKMLAMILKNIEQYVVEDKENHTAYLRLPADNRWWCWHGSETEANACYLKLLSAATPKDRKAAGLVKYLLNNRKHATYWNSTRDTALCIEAIVDYLKVSGVENSNLTVEVFVDGKKHKEVKIDTTNPFSFDNTLVLQGDAVASGKHVVEIRKKGTGPVYFNACLTNFTLEDPITKAGLEVKVNRKYYKLERIKDANVKVSGSRGQAAEQKVEKYRRIELKNLDRLKSGDLVEVELEIDSKNDYEYLLFEDMKASGCEPMLVRSGYNPNDLGAYMELRDDRVCFFVRTLARGKHSVAYRLRAEIPGQFSALPARVSAMYAPELKGNSDEIKIFIED
jgi:uncharacterized protein YfaS (alpha-2-macroglobulin family)